jgi:hypothetical protein
VESVNNKMLPNASYVNPLDFANALEFVCGRGEEIDNGTTAWFIT